MIFVSVYVAVAALLGFKDCLSCACDTSHVFLWKVAALLYFAPPENIWHVSFPASLGQMKKFPVVQEIEKKFARNAENK